ncbi:MAG: hypothetical protein M3004_13665 [Bacteroidota bacterium]|nr:hypothetical protein [Bacteroidota bacterium]
MLLHLGKPFVFLRPMMKSFFKYCLFLILFCSYGVASLELNEKESKENYSKETHVYTLAGKQLAQPSSLAVKKIIDCKDFYSFIAFAYDLFNQPSRYKYNLVCKFYSPPRLNKIYLYNSVFLI